MTERLFFALWPGEEQRLALTRVQRDLGSHQGRQTHPADLHATLVFLGDLEPQERDCAEEAAGRVDARPFLVTLDRLGCFPRSRVLWCGASDRPQPLLDLVHVLNNGLLGCGFRPERRPFAVHVTLARKARPIRARELEEPIFWPVSEFALVIGQPGERPRYRVLRRWPLT